MSEEGSGDPEREDESTGEPFTGEDALPNRGNHGSPAKSLPPPAFPPGARRRAVRRRGVEDAPDSGEEAGAGGAGFPREAIISPDEPIRKEGRGIPDDAFISPDDPVVSMVPEQEGQVTGMSLLPSPQTESGSARRDKPSIHELPYLLDQLAEHLQESGEKALDVHADMGHFQAALRSFLRGYLDGSRD